MPALSPTLAYSWASTSMSLPGLRDGSGKSRRAVAFARARVRDGEGARWSPTEFYAWTEDVESS